jgi:hypothetical protein
MRRHAYSTGNNRDDHHVAFVVGLLYRQLYKGNFDSFENILAVIIVYLRKSVAWCYKASVFLNT